MQRIILIVVVNKSLMDIINFFIDYSNSIIAFINMILIYFVFIQLRDARKPIITTKIIPREKDVIDRPYVLESGILYLVIANNSKNITHSLSVEYQFKFEGHSIKVKEKGLSHLNPEEAATILLKFKPIREKYPDLFEQIIDGNITRIVPKKKLNADLIITIHYNPLIGCLSKYKLEDNYVIEWDSQINEPKCWNKRNDEYYIYKTSGREFIEEEEGQKS